MSTIAARPSTVRGRTPADHLAIAHSYASRPEDWPLAPRFDLTRRWYHRLAAEPDAEVWLLTWLPGQATDLHDHGGSAGAFVVVSGALTERTVDPGLDGRSPRLLDRRLRAGDGRSFGLRHIHQITNGGRRPAVSVHVYTPALREMTRYRLVDSQLLVTAVDRAGADW